MQIVQTFWAFPSAHAGRDRTNGGWSSRRFYYLSVSLSCLQLVRIFEKVHLVTDKLGKYVLIDILKLPYSSITVELDQFNHYHPDLWAIGKVYSYHIQSKPFLHVDNDVFLWKSFNKRLQWSRIFVQSAEFQSPIFEILAKQLISTDRYLPEKFQRVIENEMYVPSYNAGIIGGTDLKFFKYYTKSVFEFLSNSCHSFSDSIRPLMNVVFEQFILHCLSKEKNIKVDTVFNSVQLDRLYRNNDFVQMAYHEKYLHVHFKKRNDEICRLLEQWMILLYPKNYFRLEAALKQNDI